MKIERFAGHHEAREALMLSVAGVTAIMLIDFADLVLSSLLPANRAEDKERPARDAREPLK
jgi:hypothetical protein